jgi:hypothetical protein
MNVRKATRLKWAAAFKRAGHKIIRNTGYKIPYWSDVNRSPLTKQIIINHCSGDDGNFSVVLPDNFLVLDVDTKRQVNGDWVPVEGAGQSLSKIADILKKQQSQSLRVVTRRGYHFYVKNPQAEKFNVCSDTLRGVEVFSTGSIVSLPGSFFPLGDNQHGYYESNLDVKPEMKFWDLDADLAMLLPRKRLATDVELGHGETSSDGRLNLSDEEYHSLLRSVPPTAYRDQYQQWLRYGMAFSRCCSDKDAAKEVWLDWCQSDEYYTAQSHRDDNEKKWHTFPKDEDYGGIVHIGTFIRMTQDQGSKALGKILAAREASESKQLLKSRICSLKQSVSSVDIESYDPKEAKPLIYKHRRLAKLESASLASYDEKAEVIEQANEDVFLDEIEEIIHDNNKHLFSHLDQIVCFRPDRHIVNRDNLGAELGRFLSVFRMKPEPKTDGYLQVQTKIGPSSASLISGVVWGNLLPKVTKVIDRPFIPSSGELVSEVGFHQSSGVYNTGTRWMPKVRDDLTQAECKRLMRNVDRYVKEFPFDTAFDKATWYSCLFSAFLCNEPVKPRPAVMLEGSQPSLGKSTLGLLLGIMTSGVTMPPLTMSNNKDEFRKMITSIIIESSSESFLYFDNMKNGEEIGSDFLDRLITSSRYSDRILGASVRCQIDFDRMLLFTGNNISISDSSDTLRRMLSIRLHYHGNADDRKGFTNFNGVDLLKESAMEESPRLHSILLSVAASAGKRGVFDRDIKPMKSFDYFTRRCINLNSWLGMPNILDSPNLPKNVAKASGAVLLQDWSVKCKLAEIFYHVFGEQEFSANEVFQAFDSLAQVASEKSSTLTDSDIKSILEFAFPVIKKGAIIKYLYRMSEGQYEGFDIVRSTRTNPRGSHVDYMRISRSKR